MARRLLGAGLVHATTLLLLLALSATPALGLEGSPSPRFELAASAAGAGPPQAVAAADGWLAVGDRRGVLLGREPRSLRRVLHRGPVNDVLLLPEGALLAATERGLFHRDPDGRVTDHTPAPGARSALRLAHRDGWTAVGTARGVYVSEGLGVWQRLDAGLPSGAVSALAFAEAGAKGELWVVVEGDLWRVELDASGRVSFAWRVGPPFAGRAVRGLRDLLALGSEIFALGQDTLAYGPREGGAWKVTRPGLPPGSEARRLARTRDVFWIGTDRGLVHAHTPAAAWRRATGVAGSGAVQALAVMGDTLYAAAAAGLLVGVPAPDPGGASMTVAVPTPLPLGPPIEEVQRVALAYLDLGPAEARRMRRGVRRRGWLPVVALRLATERRRFDSDESDEVFTSGALHRLHDNDLDRTRDYEAALTLSWDLGDTAFHPEEIDVSKEHREIVELRDDVLDEVNQLYYERARVLLELEARAADPSAAARLRTRAEELAAGLDAWTGGWFRRELALTSTPPGPTQQGGKP